MAAPYLDFIYPTEEHALSFAMSAMYLCTRHAFSALFRALSDSRFAVLMWLF